MTTTTKLGKMLENGKLVLMDEDGIAELDNYILVVMDNGTIHTRMSNSSISVLIQSAIETAYENGVEDLALIAYIADVMSAVYKGEDK